MVRSSADVVERIKKDMYESEKVDISQVFSLLGRDVDGCTRVYESEYAVLSPHLVRRVCGGARSRHVPREM